MAPPGQRVLFAEIRTTPALPGVEDAILHTEVLENIQEPSRALAHFARLLRTGGKLPLTVPAACIGHGVPAHFYGRYGPDIFERSMPSRGLRVDELRPIGNWGVLIAQELGGVPCVLRNKTRLDRPLRERPAAATLPFLRVAMPLFFSGLGRTDSSDDLPLGRAALATRMLPCNED